MIQDITNKLWKVVSRERMQANMVNLSRFSRYSATAEYHEAAEECVKLLSKNGFKAEILQYDAVGGRSYHNDAYELGWEIREAWCELCFDGNRRIADYDGLAMSVAERSAPCPEGEYELILMDKGPDEKEYEGIDFTGKVVFKPRGWSYNWVFDRGAVGRIDISRTETDTPTVIGWDGVGERSEPANHFGFSVSPVEAENIQNQLRSLRSRGEKAMVRCKVDSEYRHIPYELVTALLPGETEEEVLIVAHLCHPRPSCSDNLSGCVAGMEALRAIKRLVDLGEIAPLKRGIRLMLVPECKGSGAFVGQAPEEWIERIVAGINLDMVGASQNDNLAPIYITEAPHALPSIVGALCDAILNTLREDYYEKGFEYKALFNAAVMDYTTGSDHQIYCDPNVNIPMPMVGQMPDKYSHTSGDDLSRMDYFIMAKTTSLAAAYCCTLANMSRDDAVEISLEVQERVVNRIALAGRKARSGEITHESYDRRMQELDRYYGAMYDDFRRYMKDETDGEWLDAFIEKGKAMVTNSVKTIGAVTFGTEPVYTDCPLRGGKWDRVLRRVGSGPVSGLHGHAEKVPGGVEILENYYRTQGRMMHSDQNQCEYFIDGKRTIGEVIDLVRRELHDIRTVDVFYNFITLMEKLGLCEEVEDAR